MSQRKLVEQVIEEVVSFQHGGLNNSVDTMSDVVKEYTRGRDDIRGLRKSLNETQSVLTSKKTGQIPLKELWLKKVEVEESLRMVKLLESVKVWGNIVFEFCNLSFLECSSPSSTIHAAETIPNRGDQSEQSY